MRTGEAFHGYRRIMALGTGRQIIHAVNLAIFFNEHPVAFKRWLAMQERDMRARRAAASSIFSDTGFHQAVTDAAKAMAPGFRAEREVNWDAVGAIGEIVGAIAVVVTLIYLAKQVNDNSRQVKLNTTQSFASLVQDAFAPIYNSEETIKDLHCGHEQSRFARRRRTRNVLLLLRQAVEQCASTGHALPGGRDV